MLGQAMIDWWWSYLMMLYPLATTYVAGSGYRGAWIIGLWGIALWNVYGWSTGQDGFLVINFAFIVNYLRNWYLWKDGRVWPIALPR
jgi:hypothetical protein